ncbi:MAG TPA: universal stress protein [Steroidobacteraceae bacterium]|nr:universal stress protein [Steroidobacteraceae bacterium]
MADARWAGALADRRGPLMEARRRIVCATDLTARSDLALSRAVLLAKQTGARLTLVHAVDARKSERQVRAQVNRAYVQMLSMVDEESAAIDVAVKVGGRLDVIARVANEANADVVVLAAPQRRRLDFLFGTTAERLLRATGRPVLVVHREARESYRRVAMAVDLSNVSLPMIQAASKLGVLENAETTLLHANSAPLESTLKTVGVSQQAIEDYRQGWEDDARLRLQAMSTAADMPSERTRLLVRTESPALAIRQMLEWEQPELLTLGASRWVLIKRLLLGSVTDSLLRTSMSDVLVIPHAISSSASRSPIRREFPAASVQ